MASEQTVSIDFAPLNPAKLAVTRTAPGLDAGTVAKVLATITKASGIESATTYPTEAEATAAGKLAKRYVIAACRASEGLVYNSQSKGAFDIFGSDAEGWGWSVKCGHKRAPKA